MYPVTLRPVAFALPMKLALLVVIGDGHRHRGSRQQAFPRIHAH